jgi:hypothetical protein
MDLVMTRFQSKQLDRNARQTLHKCEKCSVESVGTLIRKRLIMQNTPGHYRITNYEAPHHAIFSILQLLPFSQVYIFSLVLYSQTKFISFPQADTYCRRRNCSSVNFN